MEYLENEQENFAAGYVLIKSQATNMLTSSLAQSHHQKASSRLASYVVSTFHPSGVGFIKGMTEVGLVYSQRTCLRKLYSVLST